MDGNLIVRPSHFPEPEFLARTRKDQENSSCAWQTVGFSEDGWRQERSFATGTSGTATQVLPRFPLLLCASLHFVFLSVFKFFYCRLTLRQPLHSHPLGAISVIGPVFPFSCDQPQGRAWLVQFMSHVPQVWSNQLRPGLRSPKDMGASVGNVAEVTREELLFPGRGNRGLEDKRRILSLK